MIYEKYTGREAFVSLADEPYLHIAPKAFLSCKTIESLKLPMGLKSIGDWAFAHMHNLTDLYLPAQNITLGKKVFLELYVKVNEDWRNNDRQLKRFGYELE